jgi:hypothetical protein
LFALVFVVLLPIALLLMAGQTRLFDPTTYKRALERAQVYERFPAIMAEQILLNLNANPCEANPLACAAKDGQETSLDICLRDRLGPDNVRQIGDMERPPTESEAAAIAECIKINGFPGRPENDDGAPTFLKYLTVKDWETLLRILLPASELQGVTETTIDQFFAYLGGNADRVSIPLQPVKANLARNGVEAMRELLKAQSPCDRRELEGMLRWLETGMEEGEGIPLCNPYQFRPTAIDAPIKSMLERLDPAMQTAMAAQADALPEEAVLVERSNAQARLALTNLRLGMRLSPLLPLGFLALVTLLAVRSLKGWMRWWGIPAMLGGGIALVLSFTLGPVARLALLPGLDSGISASEATLALVVSELAGNIAVEVARPLGIWGMALGVFGGAVWAASFFSAEIARRLNVEEA